ncbi:alpha/beta hydrolase [Falsiroseomonas sp. E2-1-a20]|uniref:alpha/beta hydrolase n=1 Tax=Falsiroseomonas sp. E2-1-a20 TaxID=3239300 RepID=UPI003F2FEF3C
MDDTFDGPQWGPASGGKPRHLVLLLHGVGADGFDLIDLAPGWGRVVPDALFIAPHAPESCDMAPYGRQWFSLQDRSPAQMLAGVQAASDWLRPRLDQAVASLGLSRADLVLMGFSQGAMTALHAGLRQPGGCAAVLAYAGALLGPETLAAEKQASPPVLLVHGEADEVVPAAASRRAEQVLSAAGFDVEAAYRPCLEHGIDEVGISLGALTLQRVLAAST